MPLAIDQLQASKAQLDAFPPGTLGQTEVLLPSLWACLSLFNTTRETTHLDKLIEYASAALDVTPEEEPASREIRDVLAEAYCGRGVETRSGTDVDDAIQLMLRSMGREDHSEEEKGMLHNNVAIAYIAKHNFSGYLSDLDLALEHYKSAAEALPHSGRTRQGILQNLERTHWLRFIRKGESEDFDEADKYYMESTQQLSGAAGPAPALVPNDVSVSELLHRIEALAGSGDPMLAHRRLIARIEDFLSAVPPMHPKYLYYVRQLGLSYFNVHRGTGSLFPLSRGITQLENAIKKGNQRDCHFDTCAQVLVKCYKKRYDSTEDIADLSAAIQHLTAARDIVVRSGRQPKCKMLFDLSQLHSIRYQTAVCEDDLDTALQLGKEALRVESKKDEEVIDCLQNVGVLYRTKGQVTNSVQEFNMAIENLIKAYNMLSSKEPASWGLGPKYLFQCVVWKGTLTAEVHDMQFALHWGRKLLPSIPRQHPDLGWVLSGIESLEQWLQNNKKTGVANASDDAAPGQPVEHPDTYAHVRRLRKREHHLQKVASEQAQKFLDFGKENDIKEAIEAIEELLEMTTDEFTRAFRLVHLGQMMLVQHAATGNPSILESAFGNFKRALTLAPLLSEPRALAQEGLSDAYRERYRRDGAIADLEYAIKLLEEATNIPTEDLKAQTRRLHKLGVVYAARYNREKRHPDMVKSLDLYRRARSQT